MAEFYLVVLAILHGGNILARELIKPPKACKVACISIEVMIVAAYLGGFYMLSPMSTFSA